MARIAFFGTPDFALPSLRCLQARHEVVLVVCRPDAPAGRGMHPVPCAVKREALRFGLRVMPSNLATEADITEMARALTDLRLDVGVMVAFGPEIPGRVLEIPIRGFIMAHASLLPRWRGAAPIERALEAGDDETGVSLVRLTPDRYAGPIYAVVRIAIFEPDDAIMLTARLAETAAAMLEQHLDAIVAGQCSAAPQDDVGITEARVIDKKEYVLNWSESPHEIVRKARAFAARSPLKITLDRAGLEDRRAKPVLGPEWCREKVSVLRPLAITLDHEFPPGTLLPSSDKLVFALENGGAVGFSEVQLSGREQGPAALLLQALQLTGRTELETRRRSKLVSAALRHARVAEHLVANGPGRSLDEAFHIAGFGPECAQAACLEEEWFARAVGHGFHAGASENLKLLLSLDPRARRYLPANWGAQYPILNNWTVTSRYQPTGTYDVVPATEMTRAARAVVDRVVASLWADGLLDQGALH